MDFTTFTTDDLLATMPVTEDDRWEVKSASLLDPSKKNELKKELGKQTSAFANSGGGNLVLGISNDRKIEPCEQKVGRQPMKDFLSTMVEQSVEYPIRHFRVHRIPFTGDPSNSVFVVAIEDSPAAPHQAKDEKIYYYRIDGHSKPAPHFHVELLRNRITKAVVVILHTSFNIRIPPFAGFDEQHRNKVAFCVDATVIVENRSLQIADPCALRVSSTKLVSAWRMKDVSLIQGALIQHENPLFASLHVPFKVELRVVLEDNGPLVVDHLLPAWEVLEFDVQPFSQNFVGEIVHLHPSESLGKAGNLMLETAVKGYHQTKEKMAEATGRLAEAFQQVKVPRNFP